MFHRGARLDALLVLLQLRLDQLDGAVERGELACSLFGDEGQALDALIDNAVRPLAIALRGYEKLAMWEVANEIEGLVQNKAKPAGGSLQCTQQQGHHPEASLAAAAASRCVAHARARSHRRT